MKLSVVVPAYNEEARIARTLEDLRSYLEPQVFDYEIIVVVNNCCDRTYEIVEALAEGAGGKILALNLREGGKGNAVKRGILDKATGDIVMFMDADNATPISEIQNFLPYFKRGYDLVIGSRYTNPELVKTHQPLYRIALSRLANLLIRLLAVPGVKDTQLGFKAFTARAAEDIFRLVTIKRWGFDMEVLTIAIARGYTIKEVGVSWTEHGGGHLPLKAYAESLIDLAKIQINKLSGKYAPPKSPEREGRGPGTGIRAP
jgi:dolichyl-phosphate beta-glucosyltransferase